MTENIYTNNNTLKEGQMDIEEINEKINTIKKDHTRDEIEWIIELLKDELLILDGEG